MKSTATATWKGNLKEGSGIMNSTTKYFSNLPYTFISRFVEGKGGTNPEELIAAAHAGCYSMALSADLEKAGFKPEKVEASATVTMDNGTITTSQLVVKAKVPGVSKEEFAKIATGTKSNCPVSKALNVTILLDAQLI